MSARAIKLLVYKEVSAGDLRKFDADAADADTGRGARDLRFSHEAFDPIFARLLPTTVMMPAGRKKTERVPVRRGEIRWYDSDHVRRVDIEFWPPNSARPSEGRWAKVNTIPLLARTPPAGGGRIFVLLVQDDSAAVWLYLVTEAEMRMNEWNQEITSRILGCAYKSRRAAQGYIDFENATEYCHE